MCVATKGQGERPNEHPPTHHAQWVMCGQETTFIICPHDCTNRKFLVANDMRQYVFKKPNLFPFRGRRGWYTIFWNLVFQMCFIWFHYVFIKFPMVIILSQMWSSNFQNAPNSFTFYLQSFILNYALITYIKRNKITKIKMLGLWGRKN